MATAPTRERPRLSEPSTGIETGWCWVWMKCLNMSGSWG